VTCAKAANLRGEFEERFWCEEIGFYAFTLDPDKHPVRSIASNPGHLLWSGIALLSAPPESSSG
jgi:glycogen debranching enzyme